MSHISKIIPGMTEPRFTNLVKEFGASGFCTPISKMAMIDTKIRGKTERHDLLMELGEEIEVDVDYIGSPTSGYLYLPKTKSKIFVRSLIATPKLALKPMIFGTPKSALTNRLIPWNEYIDKVIDAIEKTAVLEAHQKEVLKMLVDYFHKPNPSKKNDIPHLLKILGNIRTASVENDFAEILGPIAILKDRMIPDLIQRSAKISIPSRPNEVLVDYTIADAVNVFKISAKSGSKAATNTVKPGDIYDLINGTLVHKRKFQNTIQYKVIKILTEGSWKQGPIDACMYLKGKGYKYEVKLHWLRSDAYSEAVRQRCENTLMDISRFELDFTPMFIAATNSKVWYVKFHLKQMEFKLADRKAEARAKKKKPKRIMFRSKNNIGRKSGDKLGLAV